MNDVTLTKEQFENEAFKYYLRTDKMYNYYDYQNWIVAESLKLEQGIFQEVYLNEELKYVIPQEDTNNNIFDDLDIPDSSGDEDEESDNDEGGEKIAAEVRAVAPAGREVRRVLPDKMSGKDWNDILKNQLGLG